MIPSPTGDPLKDKERIIVVLDPGQAAFLDMMCAKIRARTGAKISRSALIRACAKALQKSRIDLSEVISEDEIASVLASAFKNK
jgi:hypothetical protein